MCEGFLYVRTMPCPSSEVRVDGTKEFVLHSEGFFYVCTIAILAAWRKAKPFENEPIIRKKAEEALTRPSRKEKNYEKIFILNS